ncbi:MAG: 2-oxoacid:acceptor oxidoreductase family protein [Ignisphaera sp.]
MKIEIAVCGVGGQGVVTMSAVIGEICVRRGLNVVAAETHGMAQRMGSVEVFVRIGDVEAPLISPASADYVVALEMVEALRGVKYLKRCGWILVSNIYIPPPGSDRVPSRRQVIELLSKLPIKMIVIDVEEIINRLEDPRVVNMAMLGALLSFKDISKILPIDVAEDVVQGMLGSVNREALAMGYRQALEKMNNGNGIYVSNVCTYSTAPSSNQG